MEFHLPGELQSSWQVLDTWLVGYTALAETLQQVLLHGLIDMADMQHSLKLMKQ